MKRLTTINVLIALLLSTTSSFSQLVAWQFGKPASVGTETTYNATTNNVNLESSVLKRGSGITGYGLDNGFSSNNWTSTLSTNRYYEFSIQPKTNYKVSLSTLDAKLRCSSYGPKNYIWKYSIDGGNTFIEISGGTLSSTNDTGKDQTQINLSGIAELQNVTAPSTVIFRVYAWNASATSGTFAFGLTPSNTTANCLAIGGTVGPIPVISSFTPTTGAIGTTVTINGKNFNTDKAKNIVFFGATMATVSAASATSLTVIVPKGATYHAISVTDLTTGLTGYSEKPFISTFSCGGFIDATSFATKQEYKTSGAVYGVAIGDLDGDGKPDLAVPNYVSQTVSLFKNTSSSGTVSFASKQDLSTSNPTSVAIGDLDGDGKPELVVGNGLYITVTVFRNTSTSGAVSFAAKQDFTTGSNPHDIAIGDLDGDGKPELVTANYGSNTISVFRNTSSSGTVSFVAKQDFTTGTQPFSVSIGDLDGDGKQDLTVPNSGSTTVSILKNTSSFGMINFADKNDLTTGSYPTHVAIGDLDGDGMPDLAVTNSSSTISVLRNTGSFDAIAFASKQDFTTGSSNQGVAIGDLDGDGKPDLAAVNSHYQINTVSVLRNTGSSGTVSFASKQDFTTGNYPIRVVIGDLDGDGQSDLAVGNYNDASVSVLRNAIPRKPVMSSTSTDVINSGATVNIPLTSNFASTYTWVAADNPNTTGESLSLQTTSTLSNTIVNNSTSVQTVTYTVTPTATGGCGEGIAQIVTVTVNPLPIIASISPSSSSITGGISVVITGVNFTSASNVKFGSSSATSFTVNSDTQITATAPAGSVGTVDITVTTPKGTSTTSSTDRFTYAFPTTISSFSPASGVVGTTVTITGTNFNTDKAKNIVFFGATLATVSAASATSLTVTVPPGATYQAISITDLITGLTAYSAQPFITTFSCGGYIDASSFTTKQDFTTGSNPQSVVIGDIDGDGKPDLVVVNLGHSSSSVSVFRNTSSSSMVSFAAKQDFKTGDYSSPISVSIGDMDGDGKPDLVVANSSSSTVSVFRNTSISGTVSFAAKQDFTTDLNPKSLAIGDMDGDGKPEFAVVNTNLNTVSVFRNTSSSGTVSFAAKQNFSTGDHPFSVVIGDVDGDSKPELAVANWFSSTVSVFRNTSSLGTISFETKQDFTTGTYPQSLAIGDMDGDGKPDLALGTLQSSTVSILRNTSNTGTVHFATNQDFPTGSGPTSVAIGDVDGDGKPDLAVVNNSSQTVSILRNMSNSGTVSFDTKQDFTTTGPWTYCVAIGDVNGDGKPDLAVANHGSNTVSVLKNTVIKKAVMSSTTTAVINSGTKVSIPLTSNFNSTYTWVAADNPNTTGESLTLQTTNTLSNTIVNNSISIQTVTYTVTPTLTDGCGEGIAQIITVTVNPLPSITAISHLSGPTTGGTIVTITGTNLTGATVKFGSINATNVTVISATEITATAPAGTAGKVDITVTTAGGTSAISSADEYTYIAAPTTLSVTSTASGLSAAIVAAGGDLSTIKNLAITGTIDATDFKAMRDNMLELAILDISEVTIKAYTGASGTGGASSITYPENEVPQYAFSNRSTRNGKNSLTSIKLPKSITSIGQDAFLYCQNLTGSLTIPPLVTTIRSEAFEGCKGLTGPLTIPSSVITIGDNAFTYCSGLTGSLIIPNGVKFIESAAFHYCNGLTGVLNIPNTVTTIGSYAFQGCKGFSSLTFEANSQLRIIPASCFSNCSGLTSSVTIPSSINSLQDYAFEGCSKLNGSITIPSSVTSIGSYAFMDCITLTSINILAITPVNLTNSANVFNNINKVNCKLTVPTDSYSAYAKATQWKDFFSITTPSPATLSGYSTTQGTVSSSKTFIVGVSATMLDLTITAPTGYEVRENNIGTFSSSLTFTSATGNISNKTIEVRIKADATVGTPSGNVVCSSNGATSKNVAASGTVSSPPPTITAISPKTGPTTGGTSVTITGTNLTGATVKFGSIDATNATVKSATEITATAPARTAGKVDITVTTAGGTSAISSTDEFTYITPATLTVTGNMRPFMHCAGSISEEQSFTVSGSDLSSDITINSLMGFEYSTTSGSDFKPSLTLPKNGTSLATTRVYVRATTAATGNSSDNISITSNNATNQTIAIARYTSGGRFYATGNTFTVSLGCSSNVNVYSVSGTKYVFKLASGSWIGSASGATIDGTTLTIDATGLSAYDTFEIINDASGASVVIGSYAAASTYNDNFIINLDKRAGIIEFKGANNFTGSNRLSVTTDSYIRTLYSTDSRLTTVNGDLTLSANMQTPANGFSFYGIILFSPVECTGTGTLTIKAKGSSYPGILCQSRIIGGTSGLLTIEGYGGESSGNNMHGVIIDGSSSFISSNGCNVSVKGTGGGSPYKSYGVFVTNGGKITSSGTSASVTVEGAGGGTLRGNDNHGVCVDYDGIITSGGSSATVTVIGRGGNTTGNSNIGVKLDYGVTITSGGGNVTVNGTGGGSGVSSLNRGVFTFGNITAGGIGEVNVIGRGGNTTGTGTVNEGILIYDCKISSNKGNVSVKGLPGGNTDTGVNVGEGGSISSGGTATSVLIEGSDENKPSSISLYSNSSSHPSSITSGGGDISIISNRISTWGTCSVTTATNGGNISLTANSLSIQSGISCGSTGILSIMQKTDGIGFDLGNGLNDAWTGPICLSPTELGYLSAGTIKLGNNKTGNIVISQANTLSSDIFLTSASTNGVKPTGYGTDLTISGKTLRFNSGTPLKISINSKPVNALTDALKVSGTVNLSGVNLTLEGNYTPLPGDVFPIISATSITNTFSGLANGETILFKGKLLKVNYTENEVTLTCFAPTATTSAAADITPLGATLNGTVNANNASTTVTFEYGLTTSYGSSVTAAQSPISGTSATAVSAALTGLEYNTTYYYRVKAENAGGITYGDRLSFKTLEKYIFTISSPTATAIKLTTAKLGATIAPANAPVLERGICWSTTKGVTIDDNKTSAGGNTAGTFTVDVSDFTENSTIYYRGYVITHYNETILSDEANFSNVPVFTGDGDWDEVTKWNVQELPNSHVNHPIINGKCTISNYSTNGLKCGDLTINEGAKLTVNPAQKFIVMGKVTNNAGVDGLVFKANASLPTASFGYVFGAPSATVEMYSKASWDLTETTGSQFNWQYFGIPVKTVPYSSVFQNCIVRRHNETAIVDANLWKMETADSTLTSGSGYEITQAAPTTYTFKGELTNAEFTRTLPYTMGAKYPGQHIFSNPFLCAIKIKKINFGANTNESIYLYNTGTQNNWKEQASFDGNAPGQYTVSTKLTAGIDGIPAQIPSMQGFLIKTTGTATGSFSVDFWDETMEDNKDLQRAPRTNATDEKVITRIDVTSKQSADRMWIFTEPTCTRNFDNGWDGYKMMGSVVNPQLFAMEADGNYQINAVPTINETYLGFQAGQDTDYTLKFTQLNVASTYNKLYLMDLVDGHIVDITADGSEYSFKASSTPQAVKRFKIVADVDNSTGNTEIVNNNLKISHSNETIYIENRSDQRGTCTLYDLKGVAIKINLFDAQKVSLISTRGLIPGVYLIKAGNGIEQVTEKIIIR